MTRVRLLVLACLCFALAAWLGPTGQRGHESVATSLGRSMGGMRVLLIDVLFLRANALVAAGRSEDLAEAQELYETVLELDEGNDAAHVYLVDMFVSQVLPLATTREARFEWWRAGWDLAHRGLKLNPRSAPIHLRIAQMLLDVRDSPVAYIEELRPLVKRIVPDREGRILHHLSAAARITDNIPNRGRIHLRELAVHGLAIALERAAAGDVRGAKAALAICAELRDRRGATLVQMSGRLLGPEGEEIGFENRLFLLQGGIAAVSKCIDAREDDNLEAARVVANAYLHEFGPNRLALALQAYVNP